jgi:ketosteroid isomerase-like protein
MPETGDDALHARLRKLEDLEEIRRIYIDYGRNLDKLDFAAYAQLFASDAKLRLGPVARADGRDEIQQVMTAQLGGSPPGSFVHLIATPQIELDGDRATGECMWAALGGDADGRPVLTSVGRHVDELVREDGRWRIKLRRGLVDIPSVMPARS